MLCTQLPRCSPISLRISTGVRSEPTSAARPGQSEPPSPRGRAHLPTPGDALCDRGLVVVDTVVACAHDSLAGGRVALEERFWGCDAQRCATRSPRPCCRPCPCSQARRRRPFDPSRCRGQVLEYGRPRGVEAAGGAGETIGGPWNEAGTRLVTPIHIRNANRSPFQIQARILPSPGCLSTSASSIKGN